MLYDIVELFTKLKINNRICKEDKMITKTNNTSTDNCKKLFLMEMPFGIL